MHAMSPKWFNFYGFKSEEVLIIQSGKFGWTHQAFEKLIAMCVGSIIEDGSAILYKPETWAWPSKIEWNVYSNHYNVYYIYHFKLQTCGFAVFFRPHESQQVVVSGMCFHSQNKGDIMWYPYLWPLTRETDDQPVSTIQFVEQVDAPRPDTPMAMFKF